MTLARRAGPVPVPSQVLIQENQRSRMHLAHKVIASKAKARITAQKQNLEVNTKLIANGKKILIYTAFEDRGVPGRSLTGSPRAIAIVARHLKRKGK